MTAVSCSLLMAIWLELNWNTEFITFQFFINNFNFI
jgi:hypothetical protein